LISAICLRPITAADVVLVKDARLKPPSDDDDGLVGLDEFDSQAVDGCDLAMASVVA
jgi:hypothetical protein